MTGQVAANPLIQARQRVETALSGGNIANPITANDVRDAIRAITSLPPNDARALIAELSRNGSLTRLASEVMDTRWFGAGGISAGERGNFFAAVAQSQDGATLAQLSNAFAQSDASPADRSEAIHNLAFAISVHASPQARLDYVNRISGAITEPQRIDRQAGPTTITTYSDAEASALATVLPTLQRGQAGAVLSRLSDVQLASVLRSGVGETSVRTSAMTIGGISTSSSSWNPSGFTAILAAARDVTDPAQRARITAAAAGEYMVTLQASSNFGHTLTGQRETLAQMRAAIGQFSGRAAMRDLPETLGSAPVTREELLLDVTQMSLDIIGIVEPTPFADGTNALISAGRGDAVGAVLSGLGIIPYLGDLAKVGKLGRWAQTMENAIQLAKTDPAFRAVIEPILSRIQGALELAGGAISRLSEGARATVGRMKAQLDELLGPSTARSDDAARNAVDNFHMREPEANWGGQNVAMTAERTGLSERRVNDILDAGRGNRPDPSTYMSAGAIARHLSRFDDGIVRITSRSSFEQRGTLGPPGGFVMPASEFERIMDLTGGDLRRVETILGLDAGKLSDSDTLIGFIRQEDAGDLRMPSGNENGAHDDFWLPGGYTSGGIVEAVMDFPKTIKFQEIRIPQ